MTAEDYLYALADDTEVDYGRPSAADRKAPTPGAALRGRTALRVYDPDAVPQPASRPVVLVIVAAIVALFGFAVDFSALSAVVVAGAYIVFLVGVVSLARQRRHGTLLAAAACVIGVLCALAVPLTWGTSGLLAAATLPLAVPGLVTAGRGRWLAGTALMLNSLLTVLFAFVWLF